MATQPQTARATVGRPQLYAALLDYHRNPGRYSLARREPALLFASIRAILQLAAGKSNDERGAAVQPAAAFFVRAALTHPGADHYTLLGVDRTSDSSTIKEHYRLMMRLVHPDFSSGGHGAAWPADAATRLNLAYGVLASPEKRARYDEDTAAAKATAMPRPPVAVRKAIVAQPSPAQVDPRLLVKRLAAGFGAAGALGVAALLVAGGGDRETLVQGRTPFKTAFLGPVLATPTAQPQPVVIPRHERPALALHPDASSPTAAATPMPPDRTLLAVAAPAALAPQPAETPVPRAAPPASALPAPLAFETPRVAPPRPNAGVTLAEAQPLLATLLQQVESGRGEKLLALLDRDARNEPAARALSRQLDLLADAQTLRLSHVEFRAEPADGRLYVIGHIKLQPGDAGASGPVKKLSLRAEFMSRNGGVVMTGLSGFADN